MKLSRRWSRCVDHRGDETETFLNGYLSDASRRCLVIAGAGFDPRATAGPRALAAALGARLSAFFIREERKPPTPSIRAAAEENAQYLSALVPASTIETVSVLAADNAVVGGRSVVEFLRRQTYAGITDVFVDISALSIGTSFPIVRYLLDAAEKPDGPPNVHALVMSSPIEDERRRRVSNDLVSIVHGFSGNLRLHGQTEMARLWIPQLSAPKLDALERIYATERFDDVCPILPFPSRDPRAADRVAYAFMELLERTWEVDARNFVHAAEDDPVDVYRTILDIEEQRRAVYAEKSEVILSPVGSKAVALGSLMAAIDRNLPVVYVEALAYNAAPNPGALSPDSQLLHVWLHGDAYPPRSEAGTT